MQTFKLNTNIYIFIKINHLQIHGHWKMYCITQHIAMFVKLTERENKYNGNIQNYQIKMNI